jgi:serine/threonine-protein kinase
VKSAPSAAPAYGRYVLEARIARGGMGEVFRAVAVGADGFEKPVVIKRVLPAHGARADFVSMFVDEAKLMTRLTHPNVVQVLDFGRGDDGAYFLVLELVRGVDLLRLIRSFTERDATVPPPLALYVAQQALRGLGFAHTQGLAGAGRLVHRDVSPANILLSHVGEVKVADFGVALVARGDRDADSKGELVGKPAYMAPEQFATDPVDARADLFSMGVILYEMLTGAHPFGSGMLERQLAASRGEIIALRELRPDLPASLDAYFATALAPGPSERVSDARSMIRALDALRSDGLVPGSADDLADVVTELVARAVLREEPVLVVGGEESRSVTRVERGPGAPTFTLGLRDAGEASVSRVGDPSPSTLRVDPRELEAPDGESAGSGASAGSPATSGDTKPRSGRRRFALAAVAMIGLGALGAAFLPRWLTGPAEPHASAAAVTASVPIEPQTSAPTVPEHTQLPIEPSAVSSTAPTSTPAIPPWAPSPVNSARPVSSAAVAASTDKCMGDVLFVATHAWTVQGGPRTVEAPGRYPWPCGTYSLGAKSRIDPNDTMSGAVTVREGAVARWQLR